MSLSVYTLLLREVIRFYRQPNRVIGALLQPLIFWLLLPLFGIIVAAQNRESAKQA